MNLESKYHLMWTFLGIILAILDSSYGLNRRKKYCPVPNGPRGVCKPVDQCEPLQYIKKNCDRKSSTYEFYLQSKGVCNGQTDLEPCNWLVVTTKLSFASHATGLKHRKLKSVNHEYPVCCPPESRWQNLTYMPISPGHNLTTDSQTEKFGNQNKTNTCTMYPLTTNDSQLMDRSVAGSIGTGQIVCGIHSSQSRIVGGDYTNIDEYPWLVLLGYLDKDITCGGSLISNRFVLTAGHCLKTADGDPTVVYLSEYNRTSYPTDTVRTVGGGSESINVTIVNVEWTVIHPGSNNDIGLVKMSEEVKFSDFIKPICLPTENFAKDFTNNTYLIAAGWGLTANHTVSEVKQDVSLPFVPISDCKLMNLRYEYLNKEKHICAGGQAGLDTCRGDSGGPLMYKNGYSHVLVGIVSHGYFVCGTRDIPGVYTNVYNYLDWINTTMNSQP